MRLQGLADYALASAGGRVVGHSRLAGPLPLWYRAWRVLAAALAGPPPVLPDLDKVPPYTMCATLCRQHVQVVARVIEIFVPSVHRQDLLFMCKPTRRGPLGERASCWGLSL